MHSICSILILSLASCVLASPIGWGTAGKAAFIASSIRQPKSLLSPKGLVSISPTHPMTLTPTTLWSDTGSNEPTYIPKSGDTNPRPKQKFSSNDNLLDGLAKLYLRNQKYFNYQNVIHLHDEECKDDCDREVTNLALTIKSIVHSFAWKGADIEKVWEEVNVVGRLGVLYVE
jgi:hypothetical protein